VGDSPCRFWDLAGTAKKLGGRDPDHAASVQMHKSGGVYYVLDCVAMQEGPAAVEERLAATAAQDRARSQAAGVRNRLRWEQEPGSAVVRELARWVQMFAGFDERQVPPVGDKVVRSRALAAQARIGNVKLVAGDWNELFLTERHGFPDWPHDDVPDAASRAMNELPQFDSGSIIGVPPPTWRSPSEEALPGLPRIPGLEF
jgi:predicted phage terminase large subunit-like protein